MTNTNTIFISLLFIFCQFFLGQQLVYAVELENAKEESISEDELKIVTHQISEYFYSHSLEPFVHGGTWQYSALGFEIVPLQDKHQRVKYLVGEITHEKEQFKVVFLVSINNETKKEYVEFLYLADSAISSRLFVDLYESALVAAGISGHGTPLYIKNKDYNEKEGGTMEWFFFNNGGVLAHLKIDLKPDGKGGNNFSIQNQR